MEIPGIPTDGYKPYRGGHILVYDMKTKKGESLCLAPNGEGVLTATMDTKRGLIHYLTGGPIYVDCKRVCGKDYISRGAARGLENLHLITCDILSGLYIDHGAIFYPDGERPTYVNSITVGDDGKIYSLARVSEKGRTDLISIPNPFMK